MDRFFHMQSHTNNDELVDSMVKLKNILSKDLEKIFRCVDRGFYLDNEDVQHDAYYDSVWDSYFALFPPRVYALVFENLKLQKGHKFLCIGSGIGYVNTVAGLLLDVNGVNHCIEICQLKIDHALQKLEEFKLNAAAIDYYNFCEPVFIHGNACDLLSTGYYDRVFCGADVPQEELEFFKSLINIGGKIVISFEGSLLSFTRKDEYTWQIVSLIPRIFFANLVLPSRYSFNVVKFPSNEPLNLQELCRSEIRSLLRTNIEKQFSDLSIATKLSSKCFVKNDTNNDKQFRISNDPTVNFSGIVLRDNSSELSDDSDVDDSDLEEDEDNECRTDDNTLGKHLLPHLTLSETPDDSTKRQFSEAGGSEKNSAVTEEENSKKMKTDSSSEVSESSSCTPLGFYGTDNWHSSMDDDSDNFILEHPSSIPVFGEANVTDGKEAEDSVTFINEHKKNKLSILLKKYIDFLPIPVGLKHFLNYFRSD